MVHVRNGLFHFGTTESSRSMGPSECLSLANNLIKGTPLEKEIIEITKKGTNGLPTIYLFLEGNYSLEDGNIS